jgi:hypothetical protein
MKLIAGTLISPIHDLPLLVGEDLVDRRHVVGPVQVMPPEAAVLVVAKPPRALGGRGGRGVSGAHPD